MDFVDLKRQNKLYKKDLMHAIENVVDQADFIMGDPLDRFEKQFATFCNRQYCIGLNSGTDALMFALLAYGIKPGDEVITVPNSYFSTGMVISNIGAIPVFVDINPLSYNIDVNRIEEKITKKTKAIIPVHLYGQAADMDPIVAIAKKHNLVIIEDCCQAHGAKYKGKILPYTETGAFSFYPGKNLGCFGDGGALITDNKDVQEKVILLRNDGAKKKYEHKIFGYKSRLDTLQAAILSFKLKHLNEFNAKRKHAAELYREKLSDIKNITLPKEMEYGSSANHIFAIQAKERDGLQKHLEKQGIATVIHYPTPIHLQDPYRKLGFGQGDFPISEEFAVKILSLPIFPEITDEEIEYVSSKIHEFYL